MTKVSNQVNIEMPYVRLESDISLEIVKALN